MSETTYPLSRDVVFPSGDVSQLWSWWNQSMPITINYMESSAPEKELKIIHDVAGYGKQLGRIIDALSVLIEHHGNSGLTKDEKEKLEDFGTMAEEIEAVKGGFAPATQDNLDGIVSAIRHWKTHNPEYFEHARSTIVHEFK